MAIKSVSELQYSVAPSNYGDLTLVNKKWVEDQFVSGAGLYNIVQTIASNAANAVSVTVDNKTIKSGESGLYVVATGGLKTGNNGVEINLATNSGLSKTNGLAVGAGTGISVSGDTVSISLSRTAPIAGTGNTISLNYGKGLDTLTESGTTKLIVKGYGKNITVDATNGVSATIPEWSGTNADYKVGDIVCRSNVIYRCSTENTNTSWTSSNWTAISSTITANPTAVDSGGSGKQAQYVKTNTKKSSYGYIDDSLLPTFDGAGLVSVSSSENTTTGRTEYTIDVPSINITNVYTSTTQNARLSQEGIEKGDIFVETVSGTTTIYLCKNVSTAATDTVGAKASATSDWVTISNPSLSGYATQTYVQNYGYASSLGVTIGTGASETVASLDSHKLSFTIPSATDAAFGVVKVDNKTITATSGVITATIPSWEQANYAAGAVVTYNKLLYRAKNTVASSVTTNPASDTTNWEVITKDSNTTYSAATSGALGLVKIPAESTSYLNNDSGTIKVAVKTNGGIAYDSTANDTGLYVKIDNNTIVNTSGTLSVDALNTQRSWIAKVAEMTWSEDKKPYAKNAVVYYNGSLWVSNSNSNNTAPGINQWWDYANKETILGTGLDYVSGLLTVSVDDSTITKTNSGSLQVGEISAAKITSGTLGRSRMSFASGYGTTTSNGGAIYLANDTSGLTVSSGALVVNFSSSISWDKASTKKATTPNAVVNYVLTDVRGYPAFSTDANANITYNIGDVVVREGTLYKCSGTGATSGTWVSSKWTATTVPEITRFTDQLTVAAESGSTVTSVAVTHNLGTKDLVVQVYEVNSLSTETSRKPVLVDYEFTSVNAINLLFASPRTNVSYYRVVILAAR